MLSFYAEILKFYAVKRNLSLNNTPAVQSLSLSFQFHLPFPTLRCWTWVPASTLLLSQLPFLTPHLTPTGSYLEGNRGRHEAGGRRGAPSFGSRDFLFLSVPFIQRCFFTRSWWLLPTAATKSLVQFFQHWQVRFRCDPGQIPEFHGPLL